MEKIRVGIFEDEPVNSKMLERYLMRGGHVIKFCVYTMDEARQVMRELEPGEINAACVDGNLSRGKRDGKDGAEIVASLKLVDPNIVVIGTSGKEDVIGADFNVRKPYLAGVLAVINREL